MLQIMFDSTTFELASTINVSIARLQATIKKGESTVESIVDAAEDVEVIKVLEDGEVVGVYNGYNTLLATVYHRDELMGDGTRADTVSVELLNNDFQAQINTLSNTVNSVQAAQTAQASAISSLGNEVSTLEETVDGKVSSDVIGNVETIGSAALNHYDVGATFMGSDSKYYRATSEIVIGTILVADGNCVETNITDEINNIKED